MDHIPYSSAVGFMYSMVCTRPNLAHGMSVISRFMANPGKSQWMAVKSMLRYIKGSINNDLIYGGAKLGEEASILGYSDVDYATDIDKRTT